MSGTAAQALAAAVARLRTAGVDDPARDARVLLADALGIDRARLTLALPEPLSDAAAGRFGALIEARASRRPVSQLLGYRDFFGHRFRITADVLDPRPETERLVELALEAPVASLLDLGTGSGCILLSVLAAMPGATGVGTDVSPAALDVAHANAADLGLWDRVEFRRGDWWQGVTGQYDLILSNPPYIAEAEMAALAPELLEWEPRGALTPGGDGLDAYRVISSGAARHLKPFGRLLVEIGATQGGDVTGLFEAAGLEAVALHRDLDGRPRVVSARKPAE